MGGIPTMLMMIAAAGVTYGWQPDKNGDDAADVEYIIQVSPAELAQLQRPGSGKSSLISSVIDPTVRGHVSRIVLRVGTGDLPRNSPAVLSTQRVATLKPAPQSGGGFGLPSGLQDTAREAASDAANQLGNQAIDRAGRVIQNGADQAGLKANNLLDRIRGNTQPPRTTSRDLVPAPSTRPRTNLAGTNQPSTSSPFAQPRTGGPSTAPARQNSQSGRDNQWSRLAAQQQNQQGANTPLASNGLRSSDTFGQMPGALQNSGLSNRDANENLFANRTGREQDTANSNAQSGINSQIDQTERDFQYGLGNDAANDRTNSGLQSPQSGTQQPRTATNSLASRGNQGNGYLGSSRSNPKLTQDQLAAGGWDFDAYNRLIDRRGQLVPADDRQPDFADRVTFANRSGNGNTLNNYPASNPQPNPQLGAPSLNDPRGMTNSGMTNSGVDNRSLASNPTSMQGRDAWGRPIVSRDDRQRYKGEQDLRDRGNFASNSATNMVDTRGNSWGTETGYPSTNNSYQDSRYQNSRSGNSNSQYSDRDVSSQNYVSRPNYDRGNEARPTYDRPALDRQPALGRENNDDSFASNSSSERLAQAGFSPAGTITKPKPVAAQPLFNGLLLISIVANLYLLFWLKNLRLQFKDMVTAKRMASSSTSVA